MDDLQFRRLKVLREVLDQPFFDNAIEELRREMADQIADEMDPVKAGAMRAERFALNGLRARLTTYVNDLTVIERKTNG